MEAHLAQIERVNPIVNAIVTLLPERALAGARSADDTLARGEAVGPLHGLPVAHKDLANTAGVRTTQGSPIYADFVPDVDEIIVERLRLGGAIMLGKTNTPEFGAGSQTFNPVFGATRNPYDLTKTCGGSSGGAAVSLACGMVPLADGSDSGGSLRNPAGYCNVAGLRPSPGRVPSASARHAWGTLGVDGIMARTAADVALGLSAVAGPDTRSPISLAEPGSVFAQPIERDFRGVRVAWLGDIPGMPVDRRVWAVLDRQREVFETLGCVVEDATPDFAGADEAFKILRAFGFALGLGDVVDAHPGLVKDTVVWNVEQGRRLTGADVGRAERLRTELYHRVRRFMERYEFLLLPVSQVPPFDINQPYVTEIEGVAQETYIDWMRSCYYISITSLPAASVPGGFTAEGLPVGLQIVGRPHADFAVLQLAHAFEAETRYWKTRPQVE
jgi:amidase